LKKKGKFPLLKFPINDAKRLHILLSKNPNYGGGRWKEKN